jgi:MerR family transcriptional regulator, copper efflux regulator
MKDTMTNLSVGQLAREGNVHLETVRYYERKGLLPSPARKKSGHRVYGPQALQRLRFIKRTQALGFALAEIKELLALRIDPKQPCGKVIEQIDDKTAEVRAKIAALRAIERTLKRMKESCEGRCSVGECPILSTLEEELSA